MTNIEKLELNDFDKIKPLLYDYKESIYENPLCSAQFDALEKAIIDNRIMYYVVKIEDDIVAMCSITTAFSTYSCEYMGIFEDFYIRPAYRNKGLASKLVHYVFNEMKKINISSVWVGCADIDLEMYKHLGFNIELGNLLTWNNN